MGDDAADALISAIDRPGLAVCICDDRDVIRYVNPFFRQKIIPAYALGAAVEFSEAVRATIASGGGTHLDSTPLDQFVDRIRERRRAMRGSYAFTTDLSDGSWLHITDVKLENGWLVAIGQDVTRLKQEEQRLRADHAASIQEARTDFLTGIPNRRYGLHLAQGLYIDASDAGMAMTMAFVDLDHFKRVNDRHGHDIGDRVLVRFVEHIVRQLRHDEVFCRTGGEEFLFASRETECERALQRLRALLVSLPEVDVGHPHLPLRFTASAGVAILQPHESCSELMRRADKALYRAKAAGRNRVELAY